MIQALQQDHRTDQPGNKSQEKVPVQEQENAGVGEDVAGYGNPETEQGHND